MTVLSAETHKLLSEALNAGLTTEEAMEYAAIDGCFAVEKGFNEAHRPDFPMDGWEPEDAFTTLAEAIAAAKKIDDWPTRIVNLAGGVIPEKTARGDTVKLQRNFTDLKQEATGDWIDRDVIQAGDEIEIVSVYDGCDQPGCCPVFLRFTVPAWPELGTLEGEIGGVTAAEILEWCG